ncbi:MAG: hypothetical protein MMC33_000560 [Icmadophila ericetorum]|nr:hypothetical protein [Icmadophila ericetorum]
MYEPYLPISASNGNPVGANGHQSHYKWSWLRARIDTKDPEAIEYSKFSIFKESLALTNRRPSLWDYNIAVDPPTVEYEEVMHTDEGVAKWTSLIRQYGFSYISNTPPTPSATQSLLERIAFIRLTHYGGFWDFTSDLSLKDTAYTTLPLPAHTDTTYFTEPCRLQLFHLLSHTSGTESGIGGSSLLVDGFHAASILKCESPEAYQILSTYPVPAHASGNEGISIQPAWAFPVLNHNPGDGRVADVGQLMQVRWNNDDRGAVGGMGLEGINRWYEAARKWVGILRRPSSEYWEQLKPGKPLSE